jgi:hypothetical protein
MEDGAQVQRVPHPVDRSRSLNAPALLQLPDEQAYKKHYTQNFCAAPAIFATAGGDVRVYFAGRAFEHAFFESTRRDGAKDVFSTERASRMPLIHHVLAESTSDRFAGWDSKKQTHDNARCVSVASGDFVVVIRLGTNQRDELHGKFVTCYVADNSIAKIRSGPVWDEAACRTALQPAAITLSV